MTVAVIGEAVMDLVQRPDGSLRPHPGGSPYNVALALGRQGVPTDYISPLSLDGFGELLRDRLLDAGVTVPIGGRSARPTSLAVVAVDEAGQAEYTLYRHGIADRDTTAEALVARMPDDLALLHTGSLALVRADLPRMRVVLRAALARGAMITVDVNMRPGVERLPEWRAAVRSLLPFCDVVKVSDADLALLGVDGDPVEAGARLRPHVGGGVVVVTQGAAGATIQNAAHRVSRAAYPVPRVVDTIGAGDCFQAGLIAWMRHLGRVRPRGLRDADAATLGGLLDHACASAALSVTRAGCDPPDWAAVGEVVRAGRVAA
ncbi:MAG: PfkB family carbohydrate kinase [bacterium]|nr:carbohydrate kinase [Myxococcales bacterium]